MSLIPPTKEWWLKLETMCYPRFDISIGKWRYHTERINGPVKIGFCHLAVEGDPQSKSKFLISENGYIYHYDTFFNKGNGEVLATSGETRCFVLILKVKNPTILVPENNW